MSSVPPTSSSPFANSVPSSEQSVGSDASASATMLFAQPTEYAPYADVDMILAEPPVPAFVQEPPVGPALADVTMVFAEPTAPTPMQEQPVASQVTAQASSSSTSQQGPRQELTEDQLNLQRLRHACRNDVVREKLQAWRYNPKVSPIFSRILSQFKHGPKRQEIIGVASDGTTLVRVDGRAVIGHMPRQALFPVRNRSEESWAAFERANPVSRRPLQIVDVDSRYSSRHSVWQGRITKSKGRRGRRGRCSGSGFSGPQGPMYAGYGIITVNPAELTISPDDTEDEFDDAATEYSPDTVDALVAQGLLDSLRTIHHILNTIVGPDNLYAQLTALLAILNHARRFQPIPMPAPAPQTPFFDARPPTEEELAIMRMFIDFESMPDD
jgi:hypothetical protein